MIKKFNDDTKADSLVTSVEGCSRLQKNNYGVVVQVVNGVQLTLQVQCKQLHKIVGLLLSQRVRCHWRACP